MPQQDTHPMLAWLIRQRLWLLAASLVLTGISAWVGRALTLDRSIEHLFAADDPLLAPYRQLQQTFGQHQIVMAVYSDPQLTTDAGLQRVKNLAQQIREIPGIVAVVSLLDPPGATDFQDQGRGARLREVFVGYTHNRALDAAGIVCLLANPTADAPPRRETLRQLRAATAQLPDAALVGAPVLIEEAFDLLQADGRRLNTWCTVLLMLTIYACFRQLRWLILALVVVQMTLALTRGVLVAMGLQLSMVSSMLAAIVTVVGVATVLHIIVRYRDARSTGLAPAEALLQAGKLLAAPVFFACLTDAAGFGALMTSSVEPVRNFGWMMALGSLLVLVSVALAVPAIVLLGNRRPAQPLPADELALQRSLGHLLQWSTRHGRLLLLGGLLAAVVAVLGCLQLVRETDFTRNFRQDSPLVHGYQFVEQRFGGAGVWDIFLSTPARLDKKLLTRILAFEKELKQQVPQLTKAISLADVLDAGVGGLKRLSLGARLAVRSGLGLMRARMPEFVHAIYREHNGRRQLRILLRAPDRLPAAERAQMIGQVQTAAARVFPSAQVTGYYVLLTRLVESLLRDQWTTFGVAAAAIFLMMTLAFRSATLALATLVPNALPVLMLFGAMGWLGVRVNMGAAMIAAVSLGLSVDGSIHYVLSYQRARRSGASVSAALQTVQATVGRAAVFATLALVIGFATLCYSDFVPTIYFGALVSLSMIGGLVGNLVVLPVLIQLLEHNPRTPLTLDAKRK